MSRITALDVSVQPRLGPRLIDKIVTTEYAAPLLTATDGFLTLPLAITIKGDLDDPRYGVSLALRRTIDSIGDAVKDLLKKGSDILPKLRIRRD